AQQATARPALGRRVYTFRPTILIHTSEPRRSPVGLRLAVAGLVVALGWPVVHWSRPAPTAVRSIELARDPQAAAGGVAVTPVASDAPIAGPMPSIHPEEVAAPREPVQR